MLGGVGGHGGNPLDMNGDGKVIHFNN